MNTPSLVAPTTYAQWSVCLDVLEQGEADEMVLAVMAAGQFDHGSGVARLFAERLVNVFAGRLDRLADRLSRDLGLGRSETDLVRALLGTRQGLTFLYRVAMLDGMPQLLRDHLLTMLRNYASQNQSSLEQSAAAHDRSGRQASVIRHNSLLRYDTPLDEPNTATAAGVTFVASPAAQSVDTPVIQTGTRKRTFL